MLPTVDSDSHSDSDSSSSPHTSACTQGGGRVFDEVDGQLYCRNCSTLSQSQTQVLEDAEVRENAQILVKALLEQPHLQAGATEHL